MYSKKIMTMFTTNQQGDAHSAKHLCASFRRCRDAQSTSPDGVPKDVLWSPYKILWHLWSPSSPSPEVLKRKTILLICYTLW